MGVPMKRRAFLQLVGVTCLPLPGVGLGEKGQAHIQLYCGDEPMSEPLPVEFRFNSRMKVTLRFSELTRVDRAVLRAPEVGERVQDFLPMDVSPLNVLDIEWVTWTGREAQKAGT